MKRIIATLAVIMFMTLLVPMDAYAQEITSVTADGTCGEIAVTVAAANLTEGCWDVKLDLPGRIETPDGEWQSAFYYRKSALCWPENSSATLNIRPDSREAVVRGTAKLRLGSKIIEKDFELQQSCPPSPEPLPDFLILVIVFGIVLIFGWLITWWRKEQVRNERSLFSICF